MAVKKHAKPLKESKHSQEDVSDYRPYKKQYRGRGYRLSRLIWITLTLLSKSWWSRSIIAISLFFVFIQVIFFLLGAVTLEASSENFFDGNRDLRMSLEPAPNETLMHEIELGGSTTFYCEIEHVGEERSMIDVNAQGPNSNWRIYTEVENGDNWIWPGDVITVRVDVYAPDNLEDFLLIEEQGLNISQDDLPSLDDLSSINIDEISQLAQGFLSGMGGINSVDSHNTSRTITVYAVWKSRHEELSSQMQNADVRTSSITSVVTLTKKDVAQGLKDNGMNTTTIDSVDTSFSIVVEGVEDIVRNSIKAGEYTDFNVFVTNNGNTTVRVAIDCLIAQSHDIGWRYETIGLSMDLGSIAQGLGGDFDLSMLSSYIDVRAGRSRNFTLRVWAGNDSIIKPYNIIVLGTDIKNPGFAYSNATLVVVKVSDVIKSDSANTTFFNLLWGGDFNFERYLWLIFLSSLAGSVLIANDLRYNSISLYFSRPLTKLEYVFGKGAALFLFLSMISIIPAIILFITGILMTSVSISYIISHLWVLGAMLLSISITLILFVMVSLAFSSLTKKWMYAGAGIFSFFIFTSILADILYATFGVDYFKLISLRADLRGVFKFFFDITYNVEAYGFDWYYPAGVVLGVILLCAGVLYLRIKAAELSE